MNKYLKLAVALVAIAVLGGCATPLTGARAEQNAEQVDKSFVAAATAAEAQAAIWLAKERVANIDYTEKRMVCSARVAAWHSRGKLTPEQAIRTGAWGKYYDDPKCTGIAADTATVAPPPPPPPVSTPPAPAVRNRYAVPDGYGLGWKPH